MKRFLSAGKAITRTIQITTVCFVLLCCANVFCTHSCWCAEQVAVQPAVPFAIQPPPVYILRDAAIQPEWEYFADTTRTMNFYDVSNNAVSIQFRPLKNPINFGVTQPHTAYWFRCRVRKHPASAAEWVLHIAYTHADSVRVQYEFPSTPLSGIASSEAGNDNILPTIGDCIPFRERPVKHRNLIFRLPLRSNEPVTVYVRFSSEGIVMLPAEMISTEELAANDRTEMLFWGVMLGILFVMTLYNLFVFMSVRDISYLYYSLYTACFLGMQIAVSGLGFEYLWGAHPTWNNMATNVGSNSALLFGLQFSRAFLQTPITMPRLDRIAVVLLIVGGVWLGLYLVGALSYVTHFRVLLVFATLFPAIAFSMGIIGVRLKQPSAPYFLAAWISLMLGVISISLQSGNLVPTNFFTLNSYRIGAVLETFLLSFALANRINKLRKDKARAQQEFVEILQNSEAVLAEQVKVRTEELELAHQRSQDLLRNIFPESIAERLHNGEEMIAETFEQVTVLFADLVGFTVLAASLPPQDLVRLLDDVFSRFDAVAKEFGLEKIKTIGDSYMLIGGAPIARAGHTEAVVDAARAMHHAVQDLSNYYGYDLHLRTGIHVGAVVAGVIGTSKFSYDLWGDTVNIASRMESHGVGGRIHCSEAVFTVLRTTHQFEERGEIEIKGKGVMKTYFLEV